jgi:hypothetical protein
VLLMSGGCPRARRCAHAAYGGGIARAQTQLRNKAVTRWMRALPGAIARALQRANASGVSLPFRADDLSNMFLTQRFFDVALNTATK